MLLVAGVRWSFRGKDAGSVRSQWLRTRPRTQSRGEQCGPAAQTIFRRTLLGQLGLPLRGQRTGIARAQLDPSCELALGAKVFRIDS